MVTNYKNNDEDFCILLWITFALIFLSYLIDETGNLATTILIVMLFLIGLNDI